MANDGKWLEKHIQEALYRWQCEHKSFFHRFYDSKSAGGYMPAQPGDFLWLLPEKPAILIEAKSTEKSASLKSLLDSGQCGKHRLWQRAGHVTAFIYADRAKNLLAWYRGEEVVRAEGKKKPVWQGTTDDFDSMFTFAAQSC
jgi:hypothetical protein